MLRTPSTAVVHLPHHNPTSPNIFNGISLFLFFFSVEGDIGTIQHCVPTGADGDECQSCFEEREEEEEEEGEEKQGEDQAPVQVSAFFIVFLGE